MSLKTRLLVFFDVILRVPPLFVIDELLQARFGLSGQVNSASSVNDNSTIYEKFVQGNVTYDAEFYNFLTLTSVKFFLSCFGCVSAICVFLLSFKRLFTVYIFIMSVGIVFLSYWANVFTMTFATNSQGSHPSVLEDIVSLNLIRILNPNSVGFIVVANYVVQFLLFFIFVFTYSFIGPKYAVLNKALPLSFLAPSLLAILPLPETVLVHSPVFAALLPLAMVKFVLWYSAVTVVQTIYSGFQHSRNVINNFGLTALVETEWLRLNVPCILRTFWLLRVGEHAAAILMQNYNSGDAGGPSHSDLFAVSALLSMFKSLLTTGCESVTAVLDKFDITGSGEEIRAVGTESVLALHCRPPFHSQYRESSLAFS
ncbi:UNVERIFIED_CONTAM: hypothetical protein PYX00_004363 [Menopon gallinae]|uniref:TRC8-like N-terminal domain-containing protein n=1 Tax=Menopon gallinae TaxID=328185 RepID=A0AAW2I469_9NEOP